MQTVQIQGDNDPMPRNGILVARAAAEIAVRLPSGWIMNLRPAKGFATNAEWFESVDTKKLYRVKGLP